MKDETKITLTAIAALLILEIFAIVNKIDGAYFAIVIALISGLAGYEIKTAFTKIQK